MKAYNRLDRRFRRDVSCSTCIKTGLHIVYKRKDDEKHLGDYGKYLTDFVCLVFTYVFPLVILHIHGVPLNMGIQ